MISRASPLIVGEVLFDEMPDGTSVLGGAPFNVAWHLEAFGLQPLLITRVGADRLGDEVLEAMESWGMNTSGVQRDDVHPTGTVTVELNDGQPEFHILPDQAYDHVDRGRAMEIVAGETFALMYRGSLISRSEASRVTADDLEGATGAPVFVDVNLRDPWWSRFDVLDTVSRARWVKVNETELGILAGAPNLAAAGAFRSEHGLDSIVVTRGERGADVVSGEGIFEAPAPGGVTVVDTVGAGDAFSAVVILGIVMGWPTRSILECALEFSAAMCSVPGATVREREFYSRFSEQGWW